MATIIKKGQWNFQPNPNKIDGFRLLTDNTRENIPKWLGINNNPGFNDWLHIAIDGQVLIFVRSLTEYLKMLLP